MGFLDKIFRRGRSAASEHGETVTAGVDKATDVVDEKTGGKVSDPLQGVDDASEKAVDKLDGPDEAAAGTEARPTPPSTP